MKPKYCMAVVLFAMSVGLHAQASVPNASGKQSASLTVTGCLQKSPTEAYTLTDTDGKRYELRTVNTEIKFADHLDQRITVTAASTPGSTTKTDQQGFLDVIALVVQSPSCKP
jgi:hypothetical protein